MTYLTRILAVAMFAVTATSAGAQNAQTSLCDVPAVAAGKAVKGVWEASNLGGAATVGGMPLPLFPANKPTKIRIVEADRGNLLVTGSWGEAMVLQPLGRGAQIPGANFGPFGCSAARAPAYRGGLRYELGVMNMSMTITLQFVSKTRGFGLAQFQGTAQGKPFSAVRPLRLVKK